MEESYLEKRINFLLVFLVFVLLASSLPVGAQPVEPDWLTSFERLVPPPAATLTLNETYGGLGGEDAYAIVQCADGGFCMVGRTLAQGATYPDVLVVRTDATGTLLWNRTLERAIGGFIDDWGNDVVLCQDGGFVILAQTRIPAMNDYDVWLIKLNSNGLHQWNYTFGTTNADGSLGFTECSDGGFALAWNVYNTTSGNTYSGVIRTNAAGIQQWNQSYQGNFGVYDIVECSNGDFALAGYVTVASQSDAWLLRMNSAGQHLWNESYSTAIPESITALIQTSSGGFLLAGNQGVVVPMDYNGLIIYTDSSGNQQWNVSLGGTPSEMFYSVVECQSGGYALTGSITDPGYTDYDLWLVRFSSSGTYLWNTSFGSTSQEIGTNIIETTNGGLAISGYTSSYGAGGFDAWLLGTQDTRFLQEPTDQVIEYGSSFSYQLNATSPFGIDAWWTNDTSNFAVSSAGLVTNATALASGVFGLQVSFNDSEGNILSTTFSVMVIAPFIPPPIPGFPIGGIVVGVAAALSLGMVTRRKRKQH